MEKLALTDKLSKFVPDFPKGDEIGRWLVPLLRPRLPRPAVSSDRACDARMQTMRDDLIVEFRTTKGEPIEETERIAMIDELDSVGRRYGFKVGLFGPPEDVLDYMRRKTRGKEV